MASPSSTPPEAEAASLPVEQPTVPDLVEESGVNKKESSKTETAVYLLYDERMTLHQPLTWKASEQRYPCCSDEIPAEYTFENPERIRHMHERLSRLETTAESSIRFHRLECQAATRETILLAHCERHYYSLQHTSILEREELIKKSQVDDDVYYCPDTFLAATLACGGVVSCVDAVTSPTTEHTRAVALVRPPGHHACQEKAMGFCYVNSVAVAAKHAITSGRANRVAIIDWDVHHGNGTQDLTYQDEDILYISLHRYGNGFFPDTGEPSQVSDGTNINIAWTYGKMGNVEYGAAFSELILPVLAEWSPDLYLVSCGLDAAKGDLLGDCEVTPDMYYSMTKSLLAVNGMQTPMVVALEGGYNIDVIAECMEAVTLALLDEPCPNQKGELVSDSQQEQQQVETTTSGCLQAARDVLIPYWDYNESTFVNQKRIRPGATRCLNKTMAAVESSKLWLDRISFRRFVHTMPERTMNTRSYRRRQEGGEAAADDLSKALNSLAL